MALRFLATLVLLGNVLSISNAGAQVNTEKMRTGDPEEGFHGSFDGSVLFKTGNVTLLQVGLGTRLEYNAGIHSPYVQGSFTFGQKGEEDDVYINKGFGHLRWSAMWHERVGSELFAQVQFNEFLRLNLRLLSGACLRVGLVVDPVVEVFLGTGYMFEHEALDLPDGSEHPKEQYTAGVHRSSQF